MSSARRRRTALFVVLAFVISVFGWWPALAAYPATQGGDGPFFHRMLEAARVSVVRYHELPLWNPYECGGVPLWDNPQSIAAAPLMLLVFVLGTTKTLLVWYVLHSTAGFLSTFLFARRDVRLSIAASTFAAGVWIFCGAYTYHLSGGHTVWVPFYYAPLALHLWRRAEERPRYAIFLGLLVAWMMHEGGIYSLPHTAVFLFAETLTRAWPPRRVGRIAANGVLVVVTAFGVGASRFLPVLAQLRAHKRNIQDWDHLEWTTLQKIFLFRDHPRPVPGQQYVWGEYSGYIGPFALGLALAGIALAGRRRAWLVALALVEFVFMLGHQGNYAPWSILHAHVYPFKDMRVPSRFVVELTLLLAFFGGIALDALPRLVARFGKVRAHPLAGTLRAALLVLAFVGVGDVIAAFSAEVARTYGGPPQTAKVAPSPHLYLGGAGLAGFIDQPQQNRGRIDCWEEWAFSWGAAVWAGDVPQARANDAGSEVRVRAVIRTQNTFTIDVDGPGRILLNDGYDQGWRTDVGAIVEQDKLLAVDVPPGSHQVHVRYWPAGLSLGFFLVFVFAAALFFFFFFGGEARLERAMNRFFPHAGAGADADAAPPPT